MKKVLIVVGTRPNFIKITQFKKVIEDYDNIELRIVHTGQHYDQDMSGVFFEQFGLKPDFFLNFDNSSVISQMTSIMTSLEQLIKDTFTPDLIIVPGDVNSTLASSIVANKLNIKLAHLESGLRSFDRNMPEEHNRIVTDQLADYLFVTEPSGLKNIESEKIKGKPYFVGNTMIDSIFHFDSEIKESTILEKLHIEQKFVLLTMHRPSNVDSKTGIEKIVNLLIELSKKYQIVFPIHPRTLSSIKEHGLYDTINIESIILTKALGYFEFQKLIESCKFILTDSGGIQEESTYRQVPCLTLRNNTERPITIKEGTNTLVPFDLNEIFKNIEIIENNQYKKGKIPEKWDGQTTKRIVEIINNEIL